MSKAKKDYYDALYDNYIQSQIEEKYITELEKQNEELIKDMIDMFEICNYVNAHTHCQTTIKCRLEQIKQKPIEEILKEA